MLIIFTHIALSCLPPTPASSLFFPTSLFSTFMSLPNPFKSVLVGKGNKLTAVEFQDSGFLALLSDILVLSIANLFLQES